MNRYLLLILSVLLAVQVGAQETETIKSYFEPAYGNWKLKDNTQVYDADNLYDYINGAADNYLSFDFMDLISASYETDPDNYIKVDVYMHKNLNQAYGIYISEKPLNAKQVNVGAQGYEEPGLLNCFTGKYYVKISTHNNSEGIQAVLLNIATDLTQKLNKEPKMPDVLKYFPIDYKIANSESFINSNFLGREFLSSAFIAKYAKGKKTFSVFIIASSSDESAKNTLAKYLKVLGQEFSGNEGRFTLNDPHNGKILLEWKGRYLWGIINDQNVKIKEDYLQLTKELLDL